MTFESLPSPCGHPILYATHMELDHGKGQLMRGIEPPTRPIDIADAERAIHLLVDEVARASARLRIERAGVPLAALVSIEDLRRLKHLDDQDREVLDALEAIRAPFRGTPAEELEHEAMRAISEDRAERQAERQQTAAVR